MFELPEYTTLARQMNESMTGKIIQKGELGNSPHKFVWYNRSREEFDSLTRGKRVGEARVRGRWLFLPLEPGYVLLLGECGGKVLLHQPGAKLPKKYHLHLLFEDGSVLTVTTQIWGARSGGNVVLSSPSETVSNTMKIVRLEKVLALLPTVEAAKSALKSSGGTAS